MIASYEAHILVPSGGSMFASSASADVNGAGRVVATNIINGINTPLEWSPLAGFQVLNLPFQGVGRLNGLGDILYPNVLLLDDGTQVTINNPSGTPVATGLRDINSQRVVVGSSPTVGPFNKMILVWDPVNGSRTLSVPGAYELLRVSESGLAVGNIEVTSGSSQGFVIDVFTGVWTHLGQALASPGNPVPWSEATDVNTDGTVIGTATIGSNQRAYIRTAAGQVTFIPTLPGGLPGYVVPLAINDNHEVVGMALTQNGWRAFYFTTGTGIHDLNDETVLPPGYRLDRATGISETGVIIGVAYDGPVLTRGFVLEPTPFLDLGHAKGGALGNPILAGNGDLTAGSMAAVVISNAPPAAPALLFIGATPNPTPFYGGTLLTIPVLVALPINTGPTGSLSLGLTVPSGLSGISLALQLAISDASASQGVALSNGLSVKFP